MHGDKAIDWNAYAETDPTGEVFTGSRSQCGRKAIRSHRDQTLDGAQQWPCLGYHRLGDTVCFVAESKNAGTKDVLKDIKITFYVSNGRWRDKHPDPVGSEMIPAKYLTKAKPPRRRRDTVSISMATITRPFIREISTGPTSIPTTRNRNRMKNNWKDEQPFKLTENPHLPYRRYGFQSQCATWRWRHCLCEDSERWNAVCIKQGEYAVAGSGSQYGPDPIVIGVDQTKQEHLREEGDNAQEEVSLSCRQSRATTCSRRRLTTTFARRSPIGRYDCFDRVYHSGNSGW